MFFDLMVKHLVASNTGLRAQWALHHILGVEMVNICFFAVQIVCTEYTINFTSNDLHGLKLQSAFSLSVVASISSSPVFNSSISSKQCCHYAKVSAKGGVRIIKMEI